ncbi:hypothetical protein [Inhella proteolytica]|uniref:Type 4 fimbrial biogenesis protein PilX N-terminal domain-containing protein n=1 Tax=Inhella proteolytica TaxID=2795029 RepID=A0A931J6J3_9BURK|nr:hypothetical protein [Inhella proteolytica]MBH9579160.1 hypothetical protein [Inhella proteolytica]
MRNELNFRHWPARQRGIASLAATLLLLMGMAVGLFYFNRGLIFEQKSSANQVRSTAATEVAEAGMEWAIGMLNNPALLNDSCVVVSSGGVGFKRRYIQTQWGSSTQPTNFATYYDDPTATTPVTNAYVGCKINGTSTTCSCPAVGTLSVHTTAGPQQGFLKLNTAAVSSPGTAVLPTFSVAFEPVRVSSASAMFEGESVRVTVTGCTATEGNCVPGHGSFGSPDATATVSAIIRFRPGLRAAPAAALTCGGNCNPGGSYNIINTDPSTNGITINAGGTITVGSGAKAVSMPGIPPQNAQVAGDASLATLASSDPTCTNSAMFQTYFGVPLDRYADASTTEVIDCSSAGDCGAKVLAAYDKGERNFYFPNGVDFNNSSGFPSCPGGGSTRCLGSVDDPVNLVTPGDFNMNGNIRVFGVVFSNSANTSDLGTGTADIIGGIVTCRDQQSNGNGTIAYDPNVMRAGRRSTGTAVRVSGSWTDACRLDASTSPPTRDCSGSN